MTKISMSYSYNGKKYKNASEMLDAFEDKFKAKIHSALLSRASDITNEYLAHLADAMQKETGHIHISLSPSSTGVNVMIKPEGFSEELTLRISEALPKLST